MKEPHVQEGEKERELVRKQPEWEEISPHPLDSCDMMEGASTAPHWSREAVQIWTQVLRSAGRLSTGILDLLVCVVIDRDSPPVLKWCLVSASRIPEKQSLILIRGLGVLSHSPSPPTPRAQTKPRARHPDLTIN